MPRLAANLTLLFNEWAFLDRFAVAAEAGFDAVEFLFPYDHPPQAVARAASAAGVRVVLFNLPPGDWGAGDRGLAALSGRAAEFTAALHRAADYAEALSVPRLHLMAGVAPRDAGHDSRYRDAIGEAAACFPDRDILLEPLNPRDMPGYFLNSFDQAVAIITAMRLPNLALQFDIYHRQILQGDVTTGLRALLPMIGHVQTASVPGRNEPGSGELDDAHIFRLLDDLGYTGHIGCEYRPRGETRAGLIWRERLGVRSGL